jgi:alpha-tubulin suppressor-like RCC1 family protein
MKKNNRILPFSIWTNFICSTNKTGILFCFLLLNSLLCSTAVSAQCWQKIAAGMFHTVAIRNDGTLWTWGDNTYGELGIGSTTVQYAPVQVGTDADWQEISAGSGFTVAIKQNGSLWAWGRNDYGELGNGSNSTQNVSIPMQIGGIAQWKTVETGMYAVMAIRNDGTLWAWGKNTASQLGIGNNVNQNLPKQVGTDNHWQKISAGYRHTLGIKSDGTLWGWGNNVYGQLGVGMNIPTYNTPVQIGTANNWQSVSAGHDHTLAIKNDGTLWAWGSNETGQLGNGTYTSENSPIQIGSNYSWKFAATGAYHSAAISYTGFLWTWGYNTYGQLGNGTNSIQNIPVIISTFTDWVQVTAGYDHTAGIRSNGAILIWGGDYVGQTGNGANTSYFTPSRVGTDNNWQAIEAGSEFSTAIKNDGKLWAWGWNEFGNLGDGTINNRFSPVQIGTDNKWQSVKPGFDYVVSIKNNGTLWAWGSQGGGQFGDSTTYTPIQIGTASNWQKVAAGSFYTLAIKNNGMLWAWGDNSNGQLGIGNTIYQNTPVQVGTDADWQQVATGWDFSLAIKTDGSLWAWGNNGNGQLGIGNTNNQNVPVRIGNANNWLRITAGTKHALAIKTDGTLWAWGYNGNGQLGDGTTTDRYAPVQIGSSSYWTKVTAANHTVAIQNNGSLWAWGDNSNGQLGDGTNQERHLPVRIGTASDWFQVASGSFFTVAIKFDGSLWSWGGNSEGQLGQGTYDGTNVPVNILCPATNLSASPASINILETAGSTTLSVTGNCLGWTISGAPQWLTVSPASGSNNATVTLTYTQNPSADMRTATLTLTGCGLSQTVTIVQNHGGSITSGPFLIDTTGENHTIILPGNLISDIDGMPLQTGDQIAVFFDVSGALKCGGYGVWNGSATSFAAFGNDVNPPGKNGFGAGETFKLKIWRKSLNQVLDATAQYAPVGTNGVVTNTNMYAKDGISIITSITAVSVYMQSIVLNAGWNLISANTLPNDPNMLNLFGSVAADVILVKDGNGTTTIPAFGVNGIGNWNLLKGYQVKASQPDTLLVKGHKAVPESTPIPLQPGWQIIAYLRDSPQNMQTLFSPIQGQIGIVKDNLGKTYIPQFGINNIGDMKPGQGYKVNALSAVNLVYQANLTAQEGHRIPVDAFNPVHFILDSTLNTGNNATVVIPVDVASGMLANGDEVGVFTTGGILCGAAVFQGNSIAITVWGDDATTGGIIEGMQGGEPYHFSIWRAMEQSEYTASITMADGTSDYEPDVVVVVASMQLMTGVGELQGAEIHSLEIFPNPTTGAVHVSLNSIDSGSLKMSLYHLDGSCVWTPELEVFQAGTTSMVLNLPEELASGMYFLQIQFDEETVCRRIIFERKK